MVIIGIDPGLNFTGWGVISIQQGGSLFLLDNGVITTRQCDNTNHKLYTIYSSLSKIIKDHNVEEASIEKVFINLNPKSSMSLCYARSAAILSIMSNGIQIHEYSSTTIKKCITGNGKSHKEQVSFMVNTLLGIRDVKLNHNSSDAIATAICHAYKIKVPYSLYR